MSTRCNASILMVAWAMMAAPAAPQTCPAPHPVFETTKSLSAQLDADFADPQGPDVYRALAGLSDPHVGAWDGPEPYEADAQNNSALLQRLFPQVKLWQGGFFPTYEVNDCRLQQPLSTLKARIAALGSHAPYVEQWIRVQQAVFSRCLRDNKVRAYADQLPPPLPIKDRRLANLQRQDRAYQSAALLFYNGLSFEAATAFDRAAARSGPDRAFARYMAIAIRAGTQPNVYGRDYKPLIPAAQSIAEAQTLLSDPNMASVHPLLYDLIGWIGASDGSVETHQVQLRQGMDSLEAPVASIATDAEARRRYRAARGDLHFEFSAFDDRAAFLDGAIPADHTSSRAFAELARTDAMAAWLVFPISPFRTQAWATVDQIQGGSRVQAELRRRGGDGLAAANPWVHEALAWRTGTYDPRRWAMVEQETASTTACGDDLAVAAAGMDMFHQVRTALMYGGDADDPETQPFISVVAHLQGYAFPTSHMYGVTVLESLRYLMSTGRVIQARRLRDALGLPGRVNADFLRAEGLTDLLLLLAEDEDHLAPLLSGDAYDMPGLLNQLSITGLSRLAARTDVVTEDRATFSRLAWARTYALGRPVDAKLNRLMRSLNPDITAGWLSDSDHAVKPQDRAALRDVLATPALNTMLDAYGRRHVNPKALNAGHEVVGVDHNKNDDDDWWCPMNPKSVGSARTADLYQALVASERWAGAPKSGWSTDALPGLRTALASSVLLRNADPAEMEALSRIERAPKLLTERTIDWVKHPGLFGRRDGQAEALALAIQTTRWGCDWAGPHGAYSRAAFDLLHQRFPTSDAAGRTKYWYDCNGDCRERVTDLPPEEPEPPGRGTF